ncbi:MAG: PfkB family carbohydrate kinase [Vicinamibacteria bacterium]
MSILAVGSVAFDSLKTPFGEVDEILGGAASHFALAASFFTSVNVVAVVGDDFTDKERSVFRGRSIDLSGLQTAPGKTFRWGGEYGYDLNERTTLFTELNVFESFQPTIPKKYRASDFVFLGNIHPSLQVDVVKQVDGPKLIAADTMNYWIERTPNELREMLAHVDILMINDAEARQLSQEYNLVRAAETIHAMGPKTLVVKRGEHGVVLFSESHRFAAPAYPLETVFDPTGAGDTFAGGFLGYLASLPAVDDRALRQAIIFGSTLGSFCVEDFGTRRLQSISRDDVVARYREFKKLTHFEDI